MTVSKEHEQAYFWRADDIAEMELLHARYITHTFDRHVHDGYALGLVEQGAEWFYYRGNKHVVAPAGSIFAINPNEIHTGAAEADNGWQYRVFYPGIIVMRQIAEELTGERWDTPHFPEPVMWDDDLANRLRFLHRTLQYSQSSLERQSVMRDVFGTMILRHASNRVNPLRVGNEKQAVRIVRDYLETHIAENTSLDELAARVGFSPYHLLRVFRKTLGMPPHTYRNHVRIVRAKAMLATGKPIADVALNLGFTDQSHFTRRFKRVVGVTPGEYISST